MRQIKAALPFRVKRFGIFISSIALLAVLIGIFVEFRHSRTTLESTANDLSSEELSRIQIELTKDVQEGDPSVAIATLKEYASSGGSVMRNCHPLLHHIGFVAYEKYQDFSKASSYSDDFCNSGYIHGLIQAFFSSTEDVSNAVLTTCDKVEQKFERWQCVHGIGHGVMYATNRSLDKSIELCELLEGEDILSCVNGVFMEHFIVVGHDGLPLEDKTKNTDISVCESFQFAYRSMCVHYSPTAYLSRNKNDYVGAFDYCGRSSARNDRKECILGVGSQIMKEQLQAPKYVAELCAQASSYEVECITGASIQYAYHTASTKKLRTLCATSFSRWNAACESIADHTSKKYDI